MHQPSTNDRTHPTGADAAPLAGRTAVVTGAGSGIGRAVAAALAGAGARAVLVGRDAERLRAAAREIAEAGGRADALAADVRERGWLAELDALAPEVDVLVQCAMPGARFAPLEEQAERDVLGLIEVGLSAAIALCAHVLPGMKARGFGRLIHVGSVAASRGGHGQAAYAAVKAGLAGLTKSVALEASRRGVTANLIELGLIETERTARAVTGAARARLIDATPAGRAGRPDEVARLVLFLCDPRSGFLTGATIALDGGLGLGVLPRRAEERC